MIAFNLIVLFSFSEFPWKPVRDFRQSKPTAASGDPRAQKKQKAAGAGNTRDSGLRVFRSAGKASDYSTNLTFLRVSSAMTGRPS